MAHVIPWDTSFNSLPVGTNKVGDTPTFIRQARQGVAERIKQEHNMELSDSATDNQGKHNEGSARCFVSATEVLTPDVTIPTEYVEGETPDFKLGRQYFDPVTQYFYVYTETGFLPVKANAANTSTYAQFALPTEVRFTSGSGFWTVPENVTKIWVKVIGGGGGGGGQTMGQDGTSGSFTGATSSGYGTAGRGYDDAFLNFEGGTWLYASYGSPGHKGGVDFGGMGGGAGGRSAGMGLSSPEIGGICGGGAGGLKLSATSPYAGGGGGGCLIENVPWQVLTVTPGSVKSYAVGAGGGGGPAGAMIGAGAAGGSGIIIIRY